MKNNLKFGSSKHKIKILRTNKDWIISLGVNLVKNWKNW